MPGAVLLEDAMSTCTHLLQPVQPRSAHMPPLAAHVQVYSMETGSEALTAVCFHPYHPVVCLADNKGFIKIINYYDSTVANVFHATSGEAGVTSLCGREHGGRVWGQRSS